MIASENKMSSPPLDCVTNAAALDNLPLEVFTIPMMNIGEYVVDNDMGY
jgi:hypothetical protein